VHFDLVGKPEREGRHPSSGAKVQDD